jgi:hypothetical protein
MRFVRMLVSFDHAAGGLESSASGLGVSHLIFPSPLAIHTRIKAEAGIAAVHTGVNVQRRRSRFHRFGFHFSFSPTYIILLSGYGVKWNPAYLENKVKYRNKRNTALLVAQITAWQRI